MGRTTRLHRAVPPRQAARARAVETRIPSPAATPAPSPLILLQRSIGNRAVGRLVQAKLRVGRPGDRFEREADRVAGQVMRMPAGAAPAAIAGGAASDTAARAGRDSSGGAVMGGADRSAAPPAPGPAVHAALSGGAAGSPLPPAARAFFEPRLGADLSAVRLHTGPAAARAAAEISANALTHGQSIHFGRGRFAPESTEGQRLLAHELIHTVQQARGSGGLIQADFQSDFEGRSEIPASQTPAAPPRTIRLTNDAGEAVWAPYGIYRPSEVPAAYQNRTMESTRVDQSGAAAGRRTVRDIARQAEGRRGPPMDVRVMMAKVGNDYRFVGYDTSVAVPGRYVLEGFVESEVGTRLVGRRLFADRVVRALRSGLPEMSLEVHVGPRTAEFHANIFRAIGREGEPRWGHRYQLTPREMMRVAVAWSEDLNTTQRSQLALLAEGANEPTEADAQRVLRGAPAPGRGGGTPPPPPPPRRGPPAGGTPTAPTRQGASRGGSPTTTPTKAVGPTPPTAGAGPAPQQVKDTPSAGVGKPLVKPGFKATPGPSFGRQIGFKLTGTGALLLLDFIMAHVMAKIERSMFERDVKALEPQIQTAINQRQREIENLLKHRQRIYANVHMEIVSNYAPDYSGGGWRYNKTKFIDAVISTYNINQTHEVQLKTVVTTLWNHRPFTYSFPLGDPIMSENMPAGFRPVLDAAASTLINISRSISVGGERFRDINKNLDVALSMLGKTWEPGWAKVAAMTDAERFKALKAAVDRTIVSMNNVFGTQPAGGERQILAMLWTVKHQLDALHEVWPLRFEEGTWHGSTP